ncbi:hypothetical protein ACO0LF_09635 [Undibacterium sp. Di27W]|uniref:hypothetical protein n=1 Tax=Undibacterium sp. Di27W TaxID=3413036 RepID=UPI003BF358C6
MSFGFFYEVEDSARDLLTDCMSKGEWYDVLGELHIENSQSCKAEESLPAWELALKEASGPLARLFTGELRAETDEFDDPSVVFLGADLVKSIAGEIRKNGKSFFESLLKEVGCDADSWLFEPMYQFFNEAAGRNKAAIILWGG